MTTNTNDDISMSKVFNELKQLRGESQVKDLLLAIVPFLVAGLSIYYSNQNVKSQIEFSKDQLAQTRKIENAKIIESFSESILNGGKGAGLARIALNSIQLTEEQKEQLSSYFEAEAGGSDKPQKLGEPSQTKLEKDTVFENFLSELFNPKRKVRAIAYTQTKNYLSNQDSVRLIDQMIAKVISEPFNIKGRSNVLSILANFSKGKLLGKKQGILEFLVEIERRGTMNPAYAVGPQTLGWIAEIRGKFT